ncbi:MAG: GNAT family N-acetyltransferase [Rhodothermales bacterium]
MTPSLPAQSPFLIRTATRQDVDILLSIEARSFLTDRISRASFRRFIRRGKARLLVADAGEGAIAGYVLLLTRKGSRRARIHSLAAHPEWRGKGVGTLLLSTALATAREWHMNEVWLEVRQGNHAAAKLYSSHGFEDMGRKTDFYADGATAILMRKRLHEPEHGRSPSRFRVPLILVDDPNDLPALPTTGRVITIPEYLRLSHAAKGRIVVNLARSYEPLSRGYYASLLAAARGERGYPGAFNLLDINWKRIHARALQEVDPMLETLEDPAHIPDEIIFHFGTSPVASLADVASLLFDRFRCPILKVRIGHERPLHIEDIEALAVHRLPPHEHGAFMRALEAFLKQRRPVSESLPRAAHSIAMLVDPAEEYPPSNAEAVAAFRRVALDLGARITPITRHDLPRLAQFDALLIRTTTALDHYTYRFARKAAEEGLPVIDAPDTILKCTNKIFLYELLKTHGIPTPETVVFDRRSLKEVGLRASWPSVLKVPDSCYSLGVFRVDDADELVARSKPLFDASDLLLLQAWTPTRYDWRIGVLDGQPLYACRYYMAGEHWQIADHTAEGGVEYGDTETVPIDSVPPDVLEVAVDAARAVGDGLLGVDCKETPRGPLVIEINDNPNLDHGVEDAVLGDELYRRILASLISRMATMPRIAM